MPRAIRPSMSRHRIPRSQGPPRTPILRQNSTLSSPPPKRSLRDRTTKPNYVEPDSQFSQDVVMEEAPYSSDSDFEKAPKSPKRKHSETTPEPQLEPKSSKRSRQAEPSELTVKEPESTTETSAKSSPPASGRCVILELPQEIFHEICLALPFASDAVPLLFTCKTIFNVLGNNNYFWFKRRRQFLQWDDTYHFNNTQMTGLVKRDMTEKYDANRDYKQLVLKAHSGKTGWMAPGASPGSDDASSGSASPEPEPTTQKGRKAKAKIGEAKVKKPEKDILRCQICCIQRAFKLWDAFDKVLCPSCFELHAIDRSDVSFLKLRATKMRLQQRRRGRSKRYCYWLPDVEKEIEYQYPGKTLAMLIAEAKDAEATRQQAYEDFRNRTSTRLQEVFLTHWQSPTFDKFREVITDDIIKSYIEAASNNLASSIRYSGTDRKPAWFLSQIPDVFAIFSDTCPSYTRLEPPQLRLNGHILINAIQVFHNQRFLAADYGREYTSDRDSSDNKFAVGTCEICYREVAERRRRGLCDELRGIRPFELHVSHKVCYRTAIDLAGHYANHHTRVALSKEHNENGEWFGFMTGVEGAEPLRVNHRDEIPPMPLPPLGEEEDEE